MQVNLPVPLLNESTLFPPKNNSIVSMLLFFCEREWMKNRCKATVRTAQQQRRRCSLYIFLLCPLWRFVVYIQTYPTPRLSTSFKKIAVFFFYAGNRGFCAVYTARRITPRTTFRCWTLRYACKHARSRSYTNPPLPTIKKP